LMVACETRRRIARMVTIAIERSAAPSMCPSWIRRRDRHLYAKSPNTFLMARVSARSLSGPVRAR